VLGLFTVDKVDRLNPVYYDGIIYGQGSVDKYSNSVGIVVKLVEALSYSEPSVRQ
jgi:hypothetical protein